MSPSLLHAVPDAIPCPAFVYDSVHDRFRFNSQAATWFGVDDPAQFRARHELSFDLYERRTPFVIPVEKSPWHRALRGEPILDVELALRIKGKGSRTLLCSASPLRDDYGTPWGALVTLTDISSIHQAEEEGRTSQAYMQALINSSSDVAIIATDTTGVITVFNTGAEKLLGYAASDMVGKKTPEAFHLASEVLARGDELTAETGQDIRGFEVFVHAARQGRSETRHWTYVTRLGEHRTVSLSASALTDGRGTIIGFLGMAVDETAQLQAEEKARLAAERFAGAFDSAAVGMALVSLEGRWMEVNDALCEMLGYTEDELLQTDFQTLTHPDDLQNDLALLQQLLANDIPNYDMLKRYFRKNGELIRARLWVSLVRDSQGAPLHFVSQIQNITDEYLARQALQSSEARLRGLFDLSPIGIGLMDYRTGRILEANDALIAPSGYTREEFMTLTDRELTPREYAPALRNAIEQIRASGRYVPFEKEYIRKDGSRYPVMVQGLLMKDPSGRQVLWSLIEDISERKRLDQIKNEFVSTVSHELRTPLTSISGALALVISGVLGELGDDVLEILNIAAKNSERLTHLVNDLLDMDKLLAGKMDIKMEQVDLLPLLDNAIRDIQAFASARNIRIVRTSGEIVPIRTDRFRLLQVLTNLLSNACKHSDRGAQVELHHEIGPENSVIISVIDHGHGIASEFRARIFQKFAQADASDTSSREGTGLGLAICKELVERMGGVIGYESKEGQGSHFWIRMPSTAACEPDRKARPRVLHVEDDEMFAHLVSTNLAEQIEVDLASSLAQANKLLRLHSYDLLLIDLFLPDGNSQSLWEALNIAQPDVPIVILSGHEVPRALAGHVAAVLTKDENALSQVVSTLERIFAMGEKL